MRASTAGGFFFVMKKVEGETLYTIIEKLKAGDRDAHRRWAFERRVNVVRKVLEALRYAHGKGVVHRDIKPANVLVGAADEVFLLDWGIAKRSKSGAPDALASTALAGSTHTHAGAVMGTPLYMSPEQARGLAADERSDLYSLCLTLYEFITLRHPFAHLTRPDRGAEGRHQRPHPRGGVRRHPYQHNPPMDLSHVLRKGVAKDPAARFQSAAELAQRLDDRAEGKVPVQCPISATKRANYELMKLVNRVPHHLDGAHGCRPHRGCVGAAALRGRARDPT